MSRLLPSLGKPRIRVYTSKRKQAIRRVRPAAMHMAAVKQASRCKPSKAVSEGKPSRQAAQRGPTTRSAKRQRQQY